MNTAHDLADDVEYLLGLGLREFQRFVANNANPSAPSETWQALLDERLARRTRSAIVGKLGDLDAQVERRKHRLRRLPDPDFPEWERRVVRLRGHLEERLRQAREATETLEASREIDPVSDGLRRLAGAVLHHRDAVQEADMEPQPADLTLWGLLDEITLPAPDSVTSQDQVTLSELLLEGPWKPQPADSTTRR